MGREGWWNFQYDTHPGHSFHLLLFTNVTNGKFGINETSDYILVGRFDATPEELEATGALVKGTEINLKELPKKAIKSLILKYYKFTPAELEVSSLEGAVTCRVAARDIP